MTKNGWPITSPVGSSQRTWAIGNSRRPTACMNSNSSAPLVPKTPPCSMRTTKRDPSSMVERPVGP